ncbi:hypothetical protein E1I69_11960 [Bacillus timonensis]|uniref:Uncharacterized protein n=1 Tax=Bacillus timonensis TaxID=1033734 RepID=A0A4S3PSF8_9BACI|nr:hypothetical protein [Bacillus timonensis]THE12226.1 hypothetical protein E1I69_11960 [Bacillus timonensis]
MQLVPEKLREPLSHFKFSIFETESLSTFFSTFKLKSYFLLLLSPIGLGASAYVAQMSFGVESLGISVGLFLFSLLVLLPWTLVPITFLFTTYHSKTWQRILSWIYVGLLIASYIYWFVLF